MQCGAKVTAGGTATVSSTLNLPIVFAYAECHHGMPVLIETGDRRFSACIDDSELVIEWEIDNHGSYKEDGTEHHNYFGHQKLWLDQTSLSADDIQALLNGNAVRIKAQIGDKSSYISSTVRTIV
jgi:hypothetical protein